MASETSLCRNRLMKFCVGAGVDLGCGGDLIVPDAIGVDLSAPYHLVGTRPIHLKGNAQLLYWFNDETLDYIFSSHLLEDFKDTKAVLEEWLRPLKIGGYLVLYLPNEQIYRKHCEKTGQIYNSNHQISEMSLEYIVKILDSIHITEIIYSNPHVDTYSFELVAKKVNRLSTQPFDKTPYFRVIHNMENEITRLKNTKSYKIGRIITDFLKFFRIDRFMKRFLKFKSTD